MSRLILAATLALLVNTTYGQAVRKLSFPPPRDMTRADIWIADTGPQPRAVLVICPGMNGSAEAPVRNPVWQQFAKENHLGLMGLSFASNPNDLNSSRGYTFVDEGSGGLLLKAVKKEYGSDLPLLLYGFSSGAYFTELFVAWKPDSVLSWCAHATGRYEKNPGAWPPGIVSCGEEDSSRYGAALNHFKAARAIGDKLLWIGLAGRNHECPPEFDDFVRAYFTAILHPTDNAIWVDIDNQMTISATQAQAQPTLSAWLPSPSLLQTWIKLNHTP